MSLPFGVFKCDNLFVFEHWSECNILADDGSASNLLVVEIDEIV